MTDHSSSSPTDAASEPDGTVSDDTDEMTEAGPHSGPVGESIKLATTRNDDRAVTPVGEHLDRESVEEDNLFLVLAQLFADFFYPVYSVTLEGSSFARSFEQKLREANIRTTADLYISGALGVGTVLGAILGILSAGLLYLSLGTLVTLPSMQSPVFASLPAWAITFLTAAKIPLALLFAGLLGSLLGLLGGIVLVLPWPYMRAKSRKREIELLLPDVVAFMYSLSVGGMNQLDIMNAVANSEDVYGEVAVEFQRVMQQTTYFGTDYQTAIQNVAETTPSGDLRKFYIDLLSIVNSGGSMNEYLEDQKDFFLQQVRRKQEDHLETLEFFGEMYMSLSILPMVLLIILVVMSMMGGSSQNFMLFTVYALIPVLNLTYIVVVSTIKQDDPGDGYLESESSTSYSDVQNLLSLGIIERYKDRAPIFQRMRAYEAVHVLKYVLTNPGHYFRLNPTHTLVFTVPAALLFIIGGVLTTTLTTNWSQFQQAYIWNTSGYAIIPFLIMTVPLAVFYEWNQRTRGRLLTTLTEDLRKLANTNQTGQPLLESMRITAQDSDSLLATEFMRVYRKVQYGRSMKPALVEFNNEYHMPRLARTVKLVSKAQEASSQITDVLHTAAEASETQDYIAEERTSRTRMQVAVIAITFLIFLGVMLILKVMFIERVVELIGQDAPTQGNQGFNVSGLDPNFLSTMYFHAVLLQGVCAGFISGYMQDADLKSGTKYAIAYVVVATLVWLGVVFFV